MKILISETQMALINKSISSDLLFEGLNKITTSDALNRQMFGPVYHGSTQEKHEKIGKDGFSIFYSGKEVSHGYPNMEYGRTGYPPPIHHLGFGIYFTTVKSIAKRFNLNSLKNISPYFLDVKNVETINFASENNMMKWWIKNGYDANLAKESEIGRFEATKKLTEYLKSKYDAVWFKGKGLYKLLDGDQIVVFNPELIYKIDDSDVKGLNVGGKVVLVKDYKEITNSDNIKDVKIKINVGTKGVITNIRDIPIEHINWLEKHSGFEVTPDMSDEYVKYWRERYSKIIEGDHKIYTVKFKKGGTRSDVYSQDIKAI